MACSSNGHAGEVGGGDAIDGGQGTTETVGQVPALDENGHTDDIETKWRLKSYARER